MVWGECRAGYVSVTAPERSTLLSEIETRFRQAQGFSLATLNLDHVVKLSRDVDFLTAYCQQTYVTADGNPIVWLSRLAGQEVSLIPGSELVDPLSALAAECAVPVALFGATQDALQAAAAELKRRYPTLDVVLCHAPAMGFDPKGAAAEEGISALKASGARLCFLALGAPKQEIFASRALAALPQVGFVSIGAGLDFVAGTQRRAPKLVQAVAAEWLWRLAGNPKRLFARYAACLAMLPKQTVTALRCRQESKSLP